MTTYLILGMTYAFAAAVQPGPLSTYLIAQALRHGWRRALPAAFSPLVSDGPIIVVILLVLSRMPTWLTVALRAAGGLLLLGLAVSALRAWRSFGLQEVEQTPSKGKSLLAATLVNLTNPGPYLGWSLIMGPLLLRAWRVGPGVGVALLVSFYGVMVATLAGIVVLFATARSLGPRVNRALVGVSAVALAVLGCYQLWSGLSSWR